MDQNYSNLELTEHDETARAPELVRHDETTTAPERDYDATAFEHDASALAPQAVSDITPQVLYDTSLPEAYDKNKESTEQPALSHRSINSTLKWVWMTTALVIAVAVAIGVGVGIWYHREHSSHKFSSVISPSAPQNVTFILNDTSLAAISLANNDRQLFFQDDSGSIRRAIRTASNNRWSTIANQDLSFNSNPKNHTPLAVVVDGFSAIDLYYISESHFLNQSSLYGNSWIAYPIGKNYSTAVDTRSLSVTSIQGTLTYNTSTINSAILYYENSTGNVSALLQRTTSKSFPFYLNRGAASQTWLDITSQESRSLPNEFRNTPGRKSSDTSYSNTLYESDVNIKYRAPLTSAANISGSTVGSLFYSPFETDAVVDGTLVGGRAIVFAGYLAGLNGTGNFSVGEGDLYDNSKPESDIAMFGTDYWYTFWIKGTQPASPAGYSGDDLPNNSFPFARLASVTLADKSASFIYHQMNGTTFAEEQWDNYVKAWLPSVYFSVSDS